MSIQCRKNAIVKKERKRVDGGNLPSPSFFCQDNKVPDLEPPPHISQSLASSELPWTSWETSGGEPLWVGRPRTCQPLPHQVKHELLPPPCSSYTEPNLTYERPPTLSQWVVSRPPASGVVIRNADSWAQLRPAGTQAGPLFSSAASLVPGKVSCTRKMLNKYLGME